MRRILSATVVTILALAMSGCGDRPAATGDNAPIRVAPAAVPAPTGAAKPAAPATTSPSNPAAPSVASAPGAATTPPIRSSPVSKAIIHTPRGDINLVLFEKTAPNTVANFVKLVDGGFYKDLAFHRVVPNFVIQGGCPNTKVGATGRPGTGGPGYTIKCETGASNPEKHSPGTLSMAHAGKDTGGSQFFVTHTTTPHLDGLHTVFGRIESKKDLDVVNAVREGDRFSIEIIRK